MAKPGMRSTPTASRKYRAVRLLARTPTAPATRVVIAVASSATNTSAKLEAKAAGRRAVAPITQRDPRNAPWSHRGPLAGTTLRARDSIEMSKSANAEAPPDSSSHPAPAGSRRATWPCEVASATA